MRTEAWQALYFLESRDAVTRWHKKICGLDLNARRSREIIASAKQAREFFRNSENSNDSVKPLLSFYGVASLSRSLTLLLQPRNGEEVLARGHGLEARDWTATLSGELSVGLASMGSIRIRTCAGLFRDFVQATANRVCLHVSSSGVDWRLSYDVPAMGKEITFDDLLSRIPDLQTEYVQSGKHAAVALVQSLTYSSDTGLKCTLSSSEFECFKASYLERRFMLEGAGSFCVLSCEAETMGRHPPQLVNTYLRKMFGSIPTLYIAEPFPGGDQYSQLAITYMTAYIMGMLARYFPTHWISLSSGEKGDAIWPVINSAQRYVDSVFPELVAEFIHDAATHHGFRDAGEAA